MAWGRDWFITQFPPSPRVHKHPHSRPSQSSPHRQWLDELCQVIRAGWLLARRHPSGAFILFLTGLAGVLVAMAGNAAQEYFSALLKGSPASSTAPLNAASSTDTLNAASSTDALLALVSFTLALFSVMLAWTLRQSYSSVSEDTYSSLAEPRGVLVFFVSRQFLLSGPVPAEGPLEVGGVLLRRQDLLADAEVLHTGLQRPFSWEMLLRGIHPHQRAGTLQRIYLLGSTPGENAVDDPGTQHLLPLCRNFLQPYVPGIPIITWAWPPMESEAGRKHECDFEMVTHVTRELKALIDHDRATHRSRDASICVDFTGGQKPSSAAAVLVSLNRRVTIQYVQTSGHKEAHSYDIDFGVGPDRLLQSPFAE